MLIKTERIKDQIIELLHQSGVKKAALFGSFVRGDATEESDIDILIEFEDGKSLLDLVRLKRELEEILHRKVDLITYNSIHPLLRDQILNEQQVII